MKFRLVSFILLVFISVSYSSTLFSKDCMVTKGSAIFREDVEKGVEKARKIALARGIIKILRKKIPLQFLKARYAILKKEIVNRAEDFVEEVKIEKKIIHGHSINLLLCVKWNENQITNVLESLSIIPEGILPPPVKIDVEVRKYNFPFTGESIYEFLKRVIEEYGFPVTVDEYRYNFLLKISSMPLRPFPLIVTVSNIKIDLFVSGNNDFEESLGEKLLYPFATTDLVVKKLREIIIEVLELTRLNWFMHIKRMNRVVVRVPLYLKNMYVKILTSLMKFSRYSSLVRVGQFTQEGLTFVVYYGNEVPYDDLIDDISSVLHKDLRLNLKQTNGGLEIERQE